jgi:hypothetical protein
VAEKEEPQFWGTDDRIGNMKAVIVSVTDDDFTSDSD